MSQMTFSDYEYSKRKKKTKREEFLDVMEEIIPWDEWVEFVRPYYPKGKRGRPTRGIEKMLRDMMINALASDYRSVYHIDLDKDEGICYRADLTDDEQTKEGIPFPYLERFRWYAENSVAESFREGFLDFIDPDNIRRGLS